MLLADVVFPQNLDELTYQVPDELSGSIKPGQLIIAPLKSKDRVSIVLRLYDANESDLPVKPSRIKPLRGLFDSRVYFHDALIELMQWIKEYYLCNAGSAFKSMFFREIIKKPKRTKPGKATPKTRWNLQLIESGFESFFKSFKGTTGFRTLLYHASSEAEELSLSIHLAEQTGRALVLTPEIEDAESIYQELQKRIPDRVCLYHSGLKPSERYDSIRGLLDGRYSVVIGTRSVVFAPFKPDVIVLTREHSLHYKQEEAPRVNVRDTAVMRGYLEEVPVVLTSITPSTESYFNVLRRKYQYISSSLDRGFPKVNIIRLGKVPEVAPYITEPLYAYLKRNADRGFLLIIQRLGYSMILCDDCEECIVCNKCMRPVMLHKSSGMLLCHNCGNRMQIPNSCTNCGGHNLSHYGAGTERIAEFVKELTSEDMEQKINIKEENQEQTILVGTLKRKGIRGSRFGCIAFLNPDIMLNQPYLKSTERFVQEIFSLKELLKDDGLLIMQTSLPWHNVYKSIKGWNYMEFLKKTMIKRKELSLPPYERIILIELRARDVQLLNEKMELIEKYNFLVIGPYRDETSRDRGFVLKILAKGSRKSKLQNRCKALLGEFRNIPVSVKVDVDPVTF
ncbi:MAG: primosomal protein N' [Nitrospirae bacterium]|nr:primosomal protein N' [Nitrospirota bacterium]